YLDVALASAVIGLVRPGTLFPLAPGRSTLPFGTCGSVLGLDWRGKGGNSLREAKLQVRGHLGYRTASSETGAIGLETQAGQPEPSAISWVGASYRRRSRIPSILVTPS